ncbi:MAG: RIP metalloprotease RseP [Spirochaetaceae bacterium]|nr:RIP metalloprotease RseP [Spirochaetaceae bacterium]
MRIVIYIIVGLLVLLGLGVLIILFGHVVLKVIIGLLGLGIVVFVHEAGHYLAAKSFGITVQTFSIGWGKKIYSFHRGGTEYCISLFPVGGYCQLKGEDVLKEAIENNSDYVEAEEGSLFFVPPWKRIIVFFAGPFMNLLFSIVVLSVIWFNGFTYHSPDNRIILVSDYSAGKVYPADMAGLKSGDKIIEIDNKTIHNYQDMRETIALNPQKKMNMIVERGGQTIELKIEPSLNKTTGAGIIGVYPWMDPVISKIEPKSPADLAGLMPGDFITEVSGNPVKNQMDFFSGLESKPENIEIKYFRNNTKYSALLELTYNEKGQTNPGFIFDIHEYSTPGYSPLGAVVKGVHESFSILFLSIKGIKTLFKGVDINQAVSGPIRITYMVGDLAASAFSESFKAGIISFFQFLCLISIALFFMNLLPIPAIDGGQIVFSLCEIIFRRNFKPKVIYRYQIVGFVFIFLLLFFTLFNDIIFFINK